MNLKPFAINEGSSKKCIDEIDVRRYVDEVFKKYDPNRDGYLEKHEVKLMLK